MSDTSAHTSAYSDSVDSTNWDAFYGSHSNPVRDPDEHAVAVSVDDVPER